MAATTRHHHALIPHGGRRVFAKFAVGDDDARELRRELEVMERVRAVAPNSAAPGCAGWDAGLGALVMDALDGDDLSAVIARPAGFTPESGRAVGSLLGGLHTSARPCRSDVPARSGPAPVHRPTPADLLDLSGGGLDLLPLVQGDDALRAHLDRVAVPPDPDTLIHGDLRAANVMIGHDGRPVLVDWECGGAGEARWDVACLVADAVSAWLHSVPSVPHLPPGDLLRLARLPMDRLRPGVGAFVAAHAAETASWLPADGHRLIDLTAVRLVHLAFDATLPNEGLRGPEVAHLQVAANVFARPLEALSFLGIDGGGA